MPFHFHSLLLLANDSRPSRKPQAGNVQYQITSWLKNQNLMKACWEISVQDSRCQTPLAHWHREQEFKSRRKVNLSACPSVAPKTHPLLLITYLQVILCLFVFEAIVQLPSCSENKNMYFLANSASGPFLPSVKHSLQASRNQSWSPKPTWGHSWQTRQPLSFPKYLPLQNPPNL